MRTQKTISSKRLKRFKGKNLPVLVDGYSEETDLLLQGRHIGQAPEIDGVTYNQPPANPALFEKCKPIYEELPGWQSPTSDLRHFEELPPNAQAYVRRIEQLTECPISMISVGPRREQTIIIRPIP